MWQSEDTVLRVHSTVDLVLLFEFVHPGEASDTCKELFHLAVVVALVDDVVEHNMVGMLEHAWILLGWPCTTAHVDLGFMREFFAHFSADSSNQSPKLAVIWVVRAFPLYICIGLA